MTALPWLAATISPVSGMDGARFCDLLAIVCVVAAACLISVRCEEGWASIAHPHAADSR